jgi:tetratricopeptide (TPR) repeat protein
MARIVGTALAVLLVATSVSAQEWRGEGRLSGKVVDEQGKALTGVAVQASLPGVIGATLQAKTDKRGEWAVNDLAAATWQIVFDLDGYEPEKATEEVDDMGRSPSIKTVLKKKFDPNAFIQTEARRGDALMQQKKFAEARAVYEGIVAKVPQVTSGMQLYIARTYYAEGQPAKAIEHLRIGLEKDPASTQTRLLLASMLAQVGSVDEAKQVASALDETKLPSPDLYLDLGFGLLKQQKAAEALQYLEKAVDKFPQSAEAYYYRASALIELVNAEKDLKNPVRVERMGRIKADLNKFLQLAPDAPQVETVKKLLEQLDKR